MACLVEDGGLNGVGVFLNVTKDVTCLRLCASIEGLARSLTLQSLSQLVQALVFLPELAVQLLELLEVSLMAPRWGLGPVQVV